MNPLLALGGALLLAASLPSSPARPLPPRSAPVDTTDVARVETYDGTLVITRLKRADAPAEFRVRVGDAVVYRDSAAQGVSLHTLTTWSRRRLALLEISSGGNGCPSAFRFVEFAEGKTPRVSAELGNCNDLPVVLMDGARLRVRFPSFYHTYQMRDPGFRRPPDATWEYLGDGRVRRLPATAATRS